jgi:serine/threonine-protein kinase SRPK3
VTLVLTYVSIPRSTRPYIVQTLRPQGLDHETTISLYLSHLSEFCSQTMTQYKHFSVNGGYYYIEDAEFLERYRPGGYHPVTIGDLLSRRYRLVHKLGHGSNSTTWLAYDQKATAYVAVKISIAEKEQTESNIVRQLMDINPADKLHPGRSIILPVLDEFDIQGPNGTHRCFINPPARTSISAVKEASLFQPNVARVIIGQLVQAVAYLHSRGVVHSGSQCLTTSVIYFPLTHF